MNLYPFKERYKRGVFALDTALFLHDLTDGTPHKFHMAFPYGYNTSSQKQREFYALARKSLITVLESRWLTPLPEIQSGLQCRKTLCEILKPISHTDIQIITDAFKRYAGRKDKNIPLLSEYAHQLRVEKRLRPCLRYYYEKRYAAESDYEKKLAKENQISAQLVLQNYMLERFLGAGIIIPVSG